MLKISDLWCMKIHALIDACPYWCMKIHDFKSRLKRLGPMYGTSNRVLCDSMILVQSMCEMSKGPYINLPYGLERFWQDDHSQVYIHVCTYQCCRMQKQCYFASLHPGQGLQKGNQMHIIQKLFGVRHSRPLSLLPKMGLLTWVSMDAIACLPEKLEKHPSNNCIPI